MQHHVGQMADDMDKGRADGHVRGQFRRANMMWGRGLATRQRDGFGCQADAGHRHLQFASECHRDRGDCRLITVELQARDPPFRRDRAHRAIQQGKHHRSMIAVQRQGSCVAMKCRKRDRCTVQPRCERDGVTARRQDWRRCPRRPRLCVGKQSLQPPPGPLLDQHEALFSQAAVRVVVPDNADRARVGFAGPQWLQQG